MVLKGHLREEVVLQYQHLMTKTTPVLCAGQANRVPDIIWNSWFDRFVAERWEQPAR